MVHIVDFKQRVNSSTGIPFNLLVIEGEAEMVKSESGRYYFTTRRASIPATFNEETCRRLIGKAIQGNIIREEVDVPYDYTIPESGEVIKLSHRYAYTPTGKNEDAVFDTHGQQSTQEARNELVSAGAM